VGGTLERILNRADAVGEHVPEQEEQDAGRHRAQDGLDAGVGAADAAERQAQEDRQTGERAEDEQLRSRRVGSSFRGV
jgi:hypothetical protein